MFEPQEKGCEREALGDVFEGIGAGWEATCAAYGVSTSYEPEDKD